MHVNKELDQKNQEKYAAGVDSEERVFNCVYCGEATCISDSYSNAGKNLICCRCARKFAKAHYETVGQWLEKNIWR